MSLKIAKIALIAVGLGIALLGSLVGALYIVKATGFQARGLDPLATTTMGAAVVTLSIGLGLPLAWQGLNSLRGLSSHPFITLPTWALAIVFATAVAAGQAILSFELLPLWLFPPFHILAAALPPLIFLTLAGRGLGVRWRALILQLANGAFLAPFGAIILEALSAFLLMFMALTVMALTPGGATWLQELLANLQNPAWIGDPDNLYKLLLSPPILLTLVLLLVIIAPLVEELLKPLGVVIMSYRRPSKSQAFLWGLASGAGFALAEGLLNGAIALEGWGVVVLMRIGGTAMHCLGGGLMGLGWHHLLTSHRPWRLLGAYAVSVGMHAIWNAASGGIVLASLAITSAPDEFSQALSGLGVLLLASLLVLQTVVMISLIYWISRKEL